MATAAAVKEHLSLWELWMHGFAGYSVVSFRLPKTEGNNCFFYKNAVDYSKLDFGASSSKNTGSLSSKILSAMNKKINTYLYYLSIVAVVGSIVWYVGSDVLLSQVFTVLILSITLLEIVSLVLVGKLFPESHTQFKIGLIVGLLVLLGIKQMAPSFFPSLTVAVLAINFVYNFYANAKAKKGAFKRRRGKKLQF